SRGFHVGHVAVEAALFDYVDFGRRRPVALVVADGDQVVGADRHSVGGAQAGRDRFQLGAVAADAQQRAVVRQRRVHPLAGTGVVKVAGAVGGQVHGEAVVVGRAGGVV